MATSFASDVEFHRLLSGASGVSLERLMLEFAGDAYPSLDAMESIAVLDRLGQAAAQRLQALDCDATLKQQLESISRLLYSDEGFQGNRQEYYDPRNSYLNEVLKRRLGIPISLSIVHLAVAARAGLPMFGVSTPGHFVVGCQSRGETWFVDPFSLGAVLDFEACRERIEQINGQPGSLGREHFRPATIREIAVRVLRNLKAAYAQDHQWQAVLPIQQRLALLLPELCDEQRDLGLVLLRTGQVHAAIELLESYTDQADAEQARTMPPYLRAARSMLAQLN